jgi:hypothetical protein
MDKIIKEFQNIIGYQVTLFDQYANECNLDNAKTLHIGFSLDNTDYQNKSITLPKNKQLITIDYLINKLSKLNDKTYQSNIEKNQALITKLNIKNAYATSYGIGLYNLNADSLKSKICDILDLNNINYKLKYSLEHYVIQWHIKH